MVAVFALVFDRMASPPVWVHMVIWPIFILVVAGAALRPVKATMVALQYRFRDVENETTGVE